MNQLAAGDKVVDMLEEWFKKVPNLPKGLTDFIVTITPWLALIGGVLLVLTGVMALVGGAALSPFAGMAGGAGVAGALLVGAVITLVLGVFYLFAFKFLRARQLNGWRLLFWGEVLYVLNSVIHLDLFSAVLSFLIGFYVLFQMKPYYK